MDTDHLLNIQKQFNWLMAEARLARSWTEFANRTSHGSIEIAKKEAGDNWHNHWLNRLQLELTVRVGKNHGQLM